MEKMTTVKPDAPFSIVYHYVPKNCFLSLITHRPLYLCRYLQLSPSTVPPLREIWTTSMLASLRFAQPKHKD